MFYRHINTVFDAIYGVMFLVNIFSQVFFNIIFKTAYEDSAMLCVCISFLLFTFFLIVSSPQILLIATWCVKLLL